MEVIVLGTEAYRQLRKEMLEEVRNFLAEHLHSFKSQLPDEVIWLNPEQARQLTGLKCRKSMKSLRETGQIHYCKIGRQYLYDKKSMNDYIKNKSTIKYQLTPKRSR